MLLRKEKIKLAMFRLILCVCLFVISVGSGGKALSNLINGDQQHDMIIICVEWFVQIIVLAFFVFKYRKSVFYPDVRQFFMKDFFWKYLLALVSSFIVGGLLPLASFQEVKISLPVWIYASVAVFCIGLFLFLVFSVFVPEQYEFQWKMKWDDIEFRKIVGHAESPEEEKQIQIGEQKIKEIIQDQWEGMFIYKKECTVNGKLTYTFHLTWKKDGIKGNYWTPDTSELLDEAQLKAARNLKEDGIAIALSDLKYVLVEKKEKATR